MVKTIIILIAIASACYLAFSQKKVNGSNANASNHFQIDENAFKPFLKTLEIETIKSFNSIVRSFFNGKHDLISEFYESVCSIAGFSTFKDNYPTTPPEFIPIATLGSDGHMYGYILLTPEMAEQGTPMANFVPIDSDGVYFAAKNFKDFIDNSITFNFLEFGFDDLEIPPKELKKLFNALEKKGFPILSEKSKKRYDNDSDDLRINKKFNYVIPKDWLFVETSDRIGILAKKKFFDPSDSHLIKANEFKAYIEKANLAYNNGYFATSLFYLRELYFQPTENLDEFKLITENLKKAYKALDREIFIKILDQNLKNFVE